MNQSAQEWQLFLCGVAFALVAFVGFGNRTDSESYSGEFHGLASSTPRYVYNGASHDYAVTPHAGSLAYAQPAGGYGDTGPGRPAAEKPRTGALTVASGDMEQDRAGTVIK